MAVLVDVLVVVFVEVLVEDGGTLVAVGVRVGDGGRGVGVAVAPARKTPRDTRMSWSPVRVSFQATYTTLPTTSRPQ